jgi:hypothetical protein
MPLSVAEAIVRKHMPVGDEYAIGLVKAPKTSTYGYQDLRGLEYITRGLQGHLFVSADQQEFFAVFDAPPNLPGRVVVATRGVWLTGVQEQAEAAEMRAEKGEPYRFLGTVLVWGVLLVAPLASIKTPVLTRIFGSNKESPFQTGCARKGVLSGSLVCHCWQVRRQVFRLAIRFLPEQLAVILLAQAGLFPSSKSSMT